MLEKLPFSAFRYPKELRFVKTLGGFRLLSLLIQSGIKVRMSQLEFVPTDRSFSWR